MPKRPSKAARCSSTTRPGTPRRPTATSRRRCSMARRRASMREGPLAELFRATEAAQRQAEREEHGEESVQSDPEATVEQAAPVQTAPEEVQEASSPAPSAPEAEPAERAVTTAPEAP